MSCERSRGFVMLVFALALAVTAPATAQPYPSKPVRVVVSYPAGGGLDLMARLVAQKLSAEFGQQFVVENRAGASGTIGADMVAKSAADGYTILAAGNPEITFMPHLNRLPYDAQSDLAPLVLVANAPSVVLVHPSVKAGAMKELLALARESPGLTYATPGRGTPMHLAFELINVETGTKFIHVPYKGGGPATNDLIAGHITVAVINAPPVLPYIKAGKVRALAVMQQERSPLLPDVPTFREATGIDNIAAPAWFAFLAPATAPADIRELLERAILQALADAGIRSKLAAAGLDVIALPGAQFKEIIRMESAYNVRTILRIGYKPD